MGRLPRPGDMEEKAIAVEKCIMALS